MTKTKTIFVCTNCGTEHLRWAGQCNSCNTWNSLVEDVVSKAKSRSPISTTQVRRLSEISHIEAVRYQTNISEFDRVLGGGIVPGGVILLGGEPGIGKSTLMLKILGSLSSHKKIYYVAGEESLEQISIRAKRLNLELHNVYFIETVNLEDAISQIDLEASLLIIDSIQVMRSSENNSIPGGMTQIKIVTDKIVELAKSNNISTLLIGHVTKDGELAGPKLLEHMVDTVLYLEGERDGRYRFLKAIKNRFGATDEVGIFSMDSGDMCEITDPTEEFREERDKLVIGSALTCTTEGNRPIIVEVQALTTPSKFGYAKRSATGFDSNRLAMIIAVLHKYFGVNLSESDVFVNISGGFKIKDTAADLAIMKALISSYKKEPIQLKQVFIGEVSLSGKIRKVSYEKIRTNEASRLGFEVVKQI